MPGLDEVLRKLASYRKQFDAAHKAAPRHKSGPAPVLTETEDFGANPGALRMLSFVPDILPGKAPLVVVLHGCTQNAADYDRGTGWSDLAQRHGFALLFPEQTRANNPNLCFNWFQPGDTSREAGEALSIRQMIETMVREHGLDRRRIAITGLSAGGAMSAVMLACYPEIFSHGAIVAGLPFGVARNVQEALGAMFTGVSKPAESWCDLVRDASPHNGPWPKVSVWHGTADTTVKPVNAAESLKQWTALHGLPPDASVTETGDGYQRRVWRDAKGTDLVEAYDIDGMGHGTPIAAGTDHEEETCGTAGSYILDVGISSTHMIARFFGMIGPAAAHARAPAARPPQPDQAPIPAAIPVAANEAPDVNGTGTPRKTRFKKPIGGNFLGDPGAVITKALRAAGLMK